MPGAPRRGSLTRPPETMYRPVRTGRTMSAPEVTEVRSAERILRSALDLFAKKGYDATSVREICEAARITKPTLYHFYKSKDGLYRALVEGTLQEFERGLVAELEMPGTTVERLQRVARLYFAQARGHRQLMRFLFALIHNPAATAPPTDFVLFYEGV